MFFLPLTIFLIAFVALAIIANVLTKRALYIIYGCMALVLLLIACADGPPKQPTPPNVRDVYATARARGHELETQVYK